MRIRPLAAPDQKFFERLRRELSGELLTDDSSRYLYSTDASYHLIIPDAVARPRNADDLQTIAFRLHEANAERRPEERIGLMMRSGGTSLTGGPIGRGLVVDVTKYFKSILDLDVTNKRVKVQPGVTYDELTAFLRPHGLMFPPNPASGIACELGGMWANNASGTRHVKYGSTRAWVRSLSAVSSSGARFRTGPVHASEKQIPRFDDPTQAEWASALWPLVRDHQDIIRQHTPQVTKNSSGYALDRLWQDEQFDFTQLLVGSEGTLALFAEAELQLSEVLPERAVALLFFESWENAGRAVAEVLPLGPVAVEMVDRHLLDIVRPHSPVVQALVPERTETALLVEFEDVDTSAVRGKIEQSIAVVEKHKLAFAHRVANDAAEQEQLWAVRKSAAMVGHMTTGARKPVPFIEDCVVLPERLPAYIRDISAVFAKHEVHVAYWGHAGNGNMHVRPALDLTDPADLDLMRQITSEVFEVVDKHGGSYTAEHGDGYTHAHLLQKKFGPLFDLFRQVKRVCDPLGYLNPQKIVSDLPDPLTTDLRMGPGDRVYVEAENRVVRDQGAITHVENCVGLGVCKDFCPSFIGLRNEQDLTRGRTNAMRGMMTGAFGDPDKYLLTPEFRKMGDTCLNCKRCAHLCPSQVDEPRHLLLARRYAAEKRGMPLLERLLSAYEYLAPWGVRFAWLANRVSRWRWVRALGEWVLGLDRRRHLPRFAGETLDDWYARRGSQSNGEKGTVVYFPGCFARYNQPVSIGRSVVELCESVGYRVVIPKTRCSGHARETYGGDMTPNVKHNIEVLEAAAAPGTPILTSCSSCRLSLVKQYPEWLEGDRAWYERAQAIAARVEDAAFFGAREAELSRREEPEASVPYHAGCHEAYLESVGKPGGRAVVGQGTAFAEQRCSGMGGTFGFKRSSRTIVEANADRLMTELSEVPQEVAVYTDCPSCRLMLEERHGDAVGHPVTVVLERVRTGRGTREMASGSD